MTTTSGAETPTFKHRPSLMMFLWEGRHYFIDFTWERRKVTHYREVLSLRQTEEGNVEETTHVPEEVDSRWLYVTCNIYEEVPGVVEQWKLFRTYTVGCHHNDKFSYETGRRRALRGALHDYKATPEQLAILRNRVAALKADGKSYVSTLKEYRSLRKEFRSRVWACYMGRPRHLSIGTELQDVVKHLTAIKGSKETLSDLYTLLATARSKKSAVSDGDVPDVQPPGRS